MGAAEPHVRSKEEDRHAVPHVSINYCFVGADDKKALPILVTRDHGTKTTFSHVVPCKGIGHFYNAQHLVANLAA